MKLNRIPQIALAASLAAGCPSHDEAPQPILLDTSVVSSGTGNATPTEKRAAAYLLEKGNTEGFRCHDYVSNDSIGEEFQATVDEARREIKAMTRCIPQNVSNPECNVDVVFDKDGNPIGDIWC